MKPVRNQTAGNLSISGRGARKTHGPEAHATAHATADPRRRGVALIMVMIAVACAFVLSFGYLGSQLTSTQISRNIVNRSQARAIAESGLNLAIAYVNSDATWRTTKPQGFWSQNQPLWGGTLALKGNDGYDSNGDGAIEGNLNFSDKSHRLTLTVIGQYKGASYTVQAVLTPTAGYVTSGISSMSSVKLSHPAQIDSFDSTLGPYGGGNVGDKATVTAGFSVSIDKNDDLHGSYVIKAVAPPMVTAPDLGFAFPPLSVKSETLTISQDLHVTSLTVENTGRIQISGDVTILSDGKVSLSNTASIEILPNSSLKIYCNGMSMKNSSSVTTASPNLSRMTIYNTGTAAISLSNTSNGLIGVIFSPNADVTMSNNTSFQGAVFAKSLTLRESAQFHQDLRITSGTDQSPIPGGGNNFSVRWLSKF